MHITYQPTGQHYDIDSSMLHRCTQLEQQKKSTIVPIVVFSHLLEPKCYKSIKEILPTIYKLCKHTEWS